MSKRCLNQRATCLMFGADHRGSLVLPLLFSTIGGLLFAMLFVNLTRFVGATNMVSQAARQVSRCLTPTDPLCAEYQTASLAPDYEWFGLEYADIYIDEFDRFDYQASVLRLDWSDNYTTYLQHQIIPVLRVPTNTVNVYRYVSNPARPYIAALFQRSAFEQTDFFTPKVNPNFLYFAEEIEDNWENNDSWFPYRIGNNEQPISINVNLLVPPMWVPSASTFTRIPSGATREFSSGFIQVPLLDGATPNSECRNCSVNVADSKPFDRWAFLALKVDGYLSQVGNEGYIPKWGGGPEYNGSEIGLQLRVYDREYNLIREVPLGGRQESSRTGITWYNLWLRGPLDSHGGNPSITYDDLAVPRGGFFLLRGWLKASSNAGAYDARVRFRFYFDDYNRNFENGPVVTRDCPQSIRQYPPLNVIETGESPSLAECGFDPNKTWVANDNNGVIREWSVDGFTCNQVDVYAFTLADIGKNVNPVSTDVATCGSYNGPDVLPAAQEGVPYCTWGQAGSEPLSTVTVGKVPPGCNVVSSQNPETVYQQTRDRIDSNYNNYVNPLQNPIVIETNAAIANLTQPANAPQFLPLTASDTWWEKRELNVVPEAQYHPTSTGLWDFSWTSAGAEFVELRSDISVQGTVYARADGNNTPPYPFLITPGGGGNPIPPQYLTDAGMAGAENPPNLISAFVSTTELVTGIYPFEHEPEIEVCGPESAWLPGENDNTWLENEVTRVAYFRQFIKNELPNHPGANDATLLSVPLPPYIDSVRLTQAEQAQPPFNETIFNCTDSREKLERRISQVVELGIYPSAVCPGRPLECPGAEPCDGNTAPSCGSAQGQIPCYEECTHKIVVNDSINDSDPTLLADTATARALGMAVVRRFDKHVREGCTEASCVNIGINVEDQTLAQVTVAYQMPLSFPLDLFLGNDSLPISTVKEEPIELLLAGRTVY